MSSEDSFRVFNYMDKSCTSCNIAMNASINKNTSDAETTRICCNQCQFWCWPLIIITDLLTCPFRLCCYYKNRK